jgi:DNA-binding NarL/FixJ family response regulator
MKRSEALTPLSHDHHQALVAAQQLRRAEDPEAATAAFLEFWRGQGSQHFRIEEDILLPAWLAADPDADRALAARLASLSPQQMRVLGLVAAGLLNKQIADRHDVQDRTVKAHLTAIFERLGVRNRTQASVLLRTLEPVANA